LRDLEKSFATGNEKLVTAQIKDRDGIFDAIKTFLGKGK
jgi:hypothetical protein